MDARDLSAAQSVSGPGSPSRPTVDQVREFHVAFNQPHGLAPKVPDVPAIWAAYYAAKLKRISEELQALALKHGSYGLLRLHLITEETSELAEGMFSQDIVKCLDALSDIQYVLDGTYLSLGLDRVKDAAFAEVHRSNMAKLGPDGKPILNEAGRVLKPEGWTPPDLRQFLARAV